jgi:hypothetical protein
MTLTTTDPELGTVRLCRGCGETWPLDSEFWYFDRDGKVMGRCRACWAERIRDADGRQRFAPLITNAQNGVRP